MSCRSKINFMPEIVGFLFMLVSVSGCIGEDLSKCSKGISLKIGLSEDTPDGADALKDISLYVFDDNDLLVDILPIGTSGRVVLDYADIPNFHCIALGNIQDGTLAVTSLKSGDPYSEGYVSLQQASGPATRAADNYSSPSDLFHGELKLENNTTDPLQEEPVITLSRKVASMNITVRGLRALPGTTDGNYSIVIHETASRMDFSGRFDGPSAAYSPAVSINGKGELAVSTFQLFPTIDNKGIAIDIYRNGALLRSVTNAGDNRPIVPVPGKTLNVLVDFEGSANIDLVITGWGKTHVWKEFG